MKRLVLPLIVIVALFGVGALVYSTLEHRERYIDAQQEEVKAQLVAEADRLKKIKAMEAQARSLSQENERLMAECLKGLDIYNNLSLFNQSRFVAPECTVTE